MKNHILVISIVSLFAFACNDLSNSDQGNSQLRVSKANGYVAGFCCDQDLHKRCGIELQYLGSPCLCEGKGTGTTCF